MTQSERKKFKAIPFDDLDVDDYHMVPYRTAEPDEYAADVEVVKERVLRENRRGARKFTALATPVGVKVTRRR